MEKELVLYVMNVTGGHLITKKTVTAEYEDGDYKFAKPILSYKHWRIDPLSYGGCELRMARKDLISEDEVGKVLHPFPTAPFAIVMDGEDDKNAFSLFETALIKGEHEINTHISGLVKEQDILQRKLAEAYMVWNNINEMQFALESDNAVIASLE